MNLDERLLTPARFRRFGAPQVRWSMQLPSPFATAPESGHVGDGSPNAPHNLPLSRALDSIRCSCLATCHVTSRPPLLPSRFLHSTVLSLSPHRQRRTTKMSTIEVVGNAPSARANDQGLFQCGSCKRNYHRLDHLARHVRSRKPEIQGRVDPAIMEADNIDTRYQLQAAPVLRLRQVILTNVGTLDKIEKPEL